MAPSEFCLQRVATRTFFQNPYRLQICSAARINTSRFYATAPRPQGLVPRQKLRIPYQNADAPKQSPAPPKENPLISSNPPKQNKYVAPNATKQVPALPGNKPLVQRKSTHYEPIAPMPQSESKSKGPVYMPRARIVIGVLLVGSILYSMVAF